MSEHGSGDEPNTSRAAGPDDTERQVTRELSRAEKEVLRRIDPGRRAVTIAAVMLVLVLSWVLPWVGSATGWQVLVGRTAESLDVGLLPHMFAINSTIVGLGLSALTLITRRWALSFLTGALGAVVSLEGVIAIWSRQTNPQEGPGLGLVLAALCMIVLAVQWVRIMWSRD
ncbi:Rv2732c family membrane protein [Salinifilum ghardaiensis]